MDQHENLGDLTLSFVHLLAASQQFDNIFCRLFLILSKLVLVVDDVELFLEQQFLHRILEGLACLLIDLVEVMLLDFFLNISFIFKETLEVLNLYLRVRICSQLFLFFGKGLAAKFSEL